jgi:hypothetical protein
VTLPEVALLADKTRSEKAGQPGAWMHGAKAKLERLVTADPGGKMGLRELYDHGLTDTGLRQIVAHDLDLLTVSTRDRDAYRAAMKAGQWGQAPQVRVSTIHGAKGDEADHVAALECCSRSPARNLQDEVRCEEETRLGYVAVTRARQSFHAVHSSAGYPYEVFGL